MLNKPIEFIKISSSGKCTITEEAIEMLSKIESNLAVISIAGIYRSGKSYLLNRLLGRQDGFEIGPNISSCTKGIWIWVYINLDLLENEIDYKGPFHNAIAKICFFTNGLGGINKCCLAILLFIQYKLNY